MSATYNPDDDALPQAPWETVYLSTRDLSSQVPINFVTHPGVCLSAACFGNGIYEGKSTEKCISNLLAAQFRRLIIDLYWDSSAQQFYLCPVAIPQGGNLSYTSSQTRSSVSAQQLSSGSFNSGPTSSQAALRARQVSTSITLGNSTTGISSATTTSSAPVTTITSASESTLVQLGSYQCDPSLNLPFIISIISDYLQQTSTTTQAIILLIELNLHAAAGANAPDGPAQAPTLQELPQFSQIVGTEFSNVVQSFIYTPAELVAQRGNLNNTWYKNPEARFPIADYFTLRKLPDGSFVTPDGWPDQDFVQLTEAKRMLLAWGSIDPQMAAYNFSADSGVIFSPGTFSSYQDISVDNADGLTSGCLYNSNETTIQQVNSSWAVASTRLLNGSNSILPFELSACGISPLLNQTFANQSAAQEPLLYVNISQASVWSWASGEPRNYSQPGYVLNDPEPQYRCALMDTSPAYAGRWRVADCQQKYRIACRAQNSPYSWQLSSSSVSFGSGSGICPDATTFGVPRTGLENMYLYNHIIYQSDNSSVWVNFNSLAVQACWVTTGPNGSCPYVTNLGVEHSRQVLIPTIAAIIALILTALTLFVKCNNNRRNSRARRRGEGGWDYEGVPS